MVSGAYVRGREFEQAAIVHAVDRDDGRVTQRGHRSGFARETDQAIAVGGYIRGQHRERNAAAQMEIHGCENDQ
jgi:hypothetical protein